MEELRGQLDGREAILDIELVRLHGDAFLINPATFGGISLLDRLGGVSLERDLDTAVPRRLVGSPDVVRRHWCFAVERWAPTFSLSIIPPCRGPLKTGGVSPTRFIGNTGLRHFFGRE